MGKKAGLTTGKPAKMLDIGYHLADMPELRTLALCALTRFMESSASSVSELEEDLISMVGGLWNHSTPSGNITTGGTESNFLALRAAKRSSGSRSGSVVMPATVHQSILK